MRAEEFFLQYEQQRAELLNGEPILRQPAEGALHETTLNLIAFPLGQHVMAHQLGYMFPAGTGFLLRRNPDLVRDPDLAFCTHERVRMEVSSDYCYFAPSLAIEVISPQDSAGEVMQRVTDYLLGGTQLVWLLYPQQEKILVHYPSYRALLLNRHDLLDGGDLLPGFSLSLSSVFPE